MQTSRSPSASRVVCSSLAFSYKLSCRVVSFRLAKGSKLLLPPVRTWLGHTVGSRGVECQGNSRAFMVSPRSFAGIRFGSSTSFDNLWWSFVDAWFRQLFCSLPRCRVASCHSEKRSPLPCSPSAHPGWVWWGSQGCMNSPFLPSAHPRGFPGVGSRGVGWGGPVGA